MKKGVLYLDYFANAGNSFRESNSESYSVAISKPPRCRFLKGDLDGLKPSNLLRNSYKYYGLPWKDYCEEYMKQIASSQEAEKNIEFIKSKLDNGIDIWLYCWEGMNKPCHRNIIGQLFFEWGYKVKLCSRILAYDYEDGDYKR